MRSGSPLLSRYTGNPRYSPIGVKRSGMNGTADPAAYHRLPLNSSQTPLPARDRGIGGIDSSVVLVGRTRSGTRGVAMAPTADGTIVPAVPTGRSSAAGADGAAACRVADVPGVPTLAGFPANDAARLPLVPASSRSRGRSNARIRSRPTGT